MVKVFTAATAFFFFTVAICYFAEKSGPENAIQMKSLQACNQSDKPSMSAMGDCILAL